MQLREENISITKHNSKLCLCFYLIFRYHIQLAPLENAENYVCAEKTTNLLM